MNNWKQINLLVPFQSKATVNDKLDSPMQVPTRRPKQQIDSVTENVIVKIQELLSCKRETANTIILHGAYACGKTTAINYIVDEIVNSAIVNIRDVWSISLNQYCTLNTVFQFLADKAKEREMRDFYTVLIKSDAELSLKIKAASEVLLNCRLFILDDIDSDCSADFMSFIQNLSNEHLVTVCTSTAAIEKANNYHLIFEIPNVEFLTAKEFADYANEVYFLEVGQDTDDLVALANCVGPLYASVIISSIKYGILSSSDIASRLMSKESIELPRNALIEKAMFMIFCQLTNQDRNTLFSIASMRLPLPVQEKGSFKQLQQLGLIKLRLAKEGEYVDIQNSMAKIIRNLMTQDSHFFEEHAQSFPTALDLWKNLLPLRLLELLSDAEKHTWPFVPETWQFKDVVTAGERYNLKDLIHKNNEFSDYKEIDILQECLYSSLAIENYETAAALVFLMDRFTYWQGTSKGTKSIVDYIEEMSRKTPIAPQLIIRKARLLKNDGDIQGAEKVLNSLIQNERQLGSWKYQNASDYDLVASVCTQIKGDILRGLGLWTDSAHDLIKSIAGFRSLPKQDKKGWASSLSLLADAFQYMSLNDFNNNMVAQYNLRASHPILEAISCVEEAARLSIYSPLFYSKNKRRAGELCSLYARLLPEDSNERTSYLLYAATECIEGLHCHTSISSLESREQYYEFVFCVYKLSKVCKELLKSPLAYNISIDKNITEMLEHIAPRLYDHYCSSEMRFQHNSWSSSLIQTTLELLKLPKIPDLENSQIFPSALHGRVDGVSPTLEPQASKQEIAGMKSQANTEVKNDKSLSDKQYCDKATVATEDLAGEEMKTSRSLHWDAVRVAETVQTYDTIDLSHKREDTLDSGIRGASTTFDTAEKNAITEDEPFSAEDCFGMIDSEQDPSVNRLASTEDFTSAELDSSKADGIKEYNSVNSLVIADLSKETHAKGLRNILTVESGTFDAEHLIITDYEGIRKEKTCLSSSSESKETDTEKRLLETMITLEERNMTELKLRTMEENLSIIKHSRKGNIHNAKVWRYDPLTRAWSTTETLAFVGDLLKLGENIEGACRDVYMFEYINQEEPMSKYIGKQYKKLQKYKERITIQQYKQDIICQVTSRYYVSLFNQQMYRKGLAFGQVQYLPTVLVELLDVEVEDELERYFNVEPYMAGNFVKITNNFTHVKKGDVQGKDLLLAFSHFSFCASNGKVIIVDIQGWTSTDQIGGTFLTDPQIHTRSKKGFGTANRGIDGFKTFWAFQHSTCNDICKALQLARPDG